MKFHIPDIFVVNHANGMGIIVENSENITFDGFNTIPSGKRILDICRCRRIF